MYYTQSNIKINLEFKPNDLDIIVGCTTTKLITTHKLLIKKLVTKFIE